MNSAYRTSLTLLWLASLATVLVGLALGAYRVPWSELGNALLGHGEGSLVVLQVRLPRVLATWMVGAALALTGAVLQALFRNPLADPSLLGVSGGAGVGAAFAIVLAGSAALGGWSVTLAAFTGAILVALVIAAVASRGVSPVTLILVGVAIEAISFALLGIVTFVADDTQLRALRFWLLGGFNGVTWPLLLATGPVVVLGLLSMLPMGHGLNLMTLGAEQARHLGLNASRFRLLAVVATSLAVGASVAAAGIVGFVGILVPHALRLAVGADHRWLLSASVATGGMFLTLADLAARSLAPPAELPVGIITAGIGGPFFLWLILSGREGVRA